MKCTIIGAGRLGKNIGLALATERLISSLSIYNRSETSARKACAEMNGGEVITTLTQLPSTDILWLSCNDDAISPLVHTLAQKNCLHPGTFVIHSSGVLNSDVLSPLKEQGCLVASFHPLKAFKANYLDAMAFKHVDCVLEGDEPVCAWLTTSFTYLGAYVTPIKPEHKAKYHAAACIASNYLITLAARSEALLIEAGLPAEQSRRMIVNLMQSNINNIHHSKQLTDALSGPLARGDINTLSLHLGVLDDPQTQRLYASAGQATLALTPLEQKLKEEIHTLLDAVHLRPEHS